MRWKFPPAAFTKSGSAAKQVATPAAETKVTREGEAPVESTTAGLSRPDRQSYAATTEASTDAT